MLQFDIITIFPKMFSPVLNESMIKRAQEKKKIQIKIHDLRNFSMDKHRKIDDRPFGGGPGMLMAPQPIFDCVSKIKGKSKVKVILMSPAGKSLTQKLAKTLVKHKQLIVICGHYEGVDERVREGLVDESISIGDYVLTGGELPAMVLVDCITRLVPGVLGKEESLHFESFEAGLLDYPQYTRPANFRGMKVPSVLLSGHHKDIKEWRAKKSLAETKKVRPDLIKKQKKS